MDVHLAFYPVPENLSESHAQALATALIGSAGNSAEQLALAISLLHGSWFGSRMHLTAHLEHLKYAASPEGWEQTFINDKALLDFSELLPDPTALFAAMSALEAWGHMLKSAGSEQAQSAFFSATEKLEAVVQLAPGDASSSEILNKLLALPTPQSTERLRARVKALLGSSPYPSMAGAEARMPAEFLFMPVDNSGKMAFLQTLMAAGMAGIGTTTGRLRSDMPNTSNTPQSAEPYRQELEPDQLSPSPDTVEVFRVDEVAKALSKMPSGGPFDDNKKQLRIMEMMARESGRRSLAQAPQLEALDELVERFPHFSPVLDFVRNSLALAACGEEGRPAVLPPILLRGAPGTGKTYFAQELARILGTDFIERDLSVTSEAFVISGMDAAWKNSKPGIVFDAIVQGTLANPLILLNEVDKAMTAGSKNSPLAPLHALLEPTSAERFVDEYVPVPVNASKVIWILTANDGDIPAPILSRLEVFDIPEPSFDECKLIAQSVWASVCSRSLPKGHGFLEKLDAGLLEHVAKVSPRVMRKALTHAASTAVMNGRKVLQVSDLEASGKRYAPPVQKTLGFLQ